MERTVTAGLDVHKSSVQLAVVRRDELVAEQKLPYDHEAVYHSLARWPALRCCYEAGPTGFGLQRYLSEHGIDCEVVAPPGLVPARATDRGNSHRSAPRHRAG
jgi:transposase